ncbi:hypothetical protein A8L45_06130 [Veronia pacifica]|uniref:N-acetyltransferase domain-containing protein n=2 Tax=Veronia pacifica TaxID=1080227 RepID=A0A1C3EMW1_9GAMM|nr:hypothetical protein A8L45_06130 [Veronia pacifica]
MNIRVAQVNDAERIEMLNAQIGVSLSLSIIREKLAHMRASNNDLVLVAEVCGLVVGYAALHLQPVFFQDQPNGRVSSLVIDETFREMTIGTQLLDAARSFFNNKQCCRVEVSSPFHPDDAGGFYLNVGYRLTPSRYLRLIASQQSTDSDRGNVCRPAGWQ